jgi:quercetin dioxygenase-like cupin family protein
MHSLTEFDSQAGASWFSDELASVASGSSGQPALVERSAPGGSMPPLLRRDTAETYRVTEGEIAFFVGDDVVVARAGDVVVAPAGTPRTFRVDSDSARWLVLTHVQKLDSFVDFGRAVSTTQADPSTGWPSEEERSAVAAMGAANGIELLGPPGALPRRAMLRAAYSGGVPPATTGR